MYTNNISYRNTPDAWMDHTLDTTHSCGQNAGQVSAAEERHLASLHLATQLPALHRIPKQVPRQWRQWSGALLVRVGNRLQGVAVPTGTQIASEPH
jgi:hypothetical protein